MGPDQHRAPGDVPRPVPGAVWCSGARGCLWGPSPHSSLRGGGKTWSPQGERGTGAGEVPGEGEPEASGERGV